MLTRMAGAVRFAMNCVSFVALLACVASVDESVPWQISVRNARTQDLSTKESNRIHSDARQKVIMVDTCAPVRRASSMMTNTQKTMKRSLQ